MRPRCGALLVGLLVGVGGCSRDPAAASRAHIGRGDRYVQAGKFREATIEYRNAIKYAPESAEGHSKLADAAARANDSKTALLEYLRVADLDPANAAAQVRAASVYLLAGRYDEARERAEAALGSAPDYAPAHLALGEALAGLDIGARSRSSLAEAVRLAPHSPEPHVALGSALWAAGQTVEAEAELRRAVEAEASHAGAHRALALFLMATDRLAEAESHWKVVAQAPGVDPFALADYYVVANRPEDAARELVRLAGQGATRDAAALRLAPLQFMRGNRSDAYTTIDELTSRDSPNLAAQSLRVRLLAAEGRLDEALAAVRSASTADAASPHLLLLQGEVLAAKGDDWGALEAFKAAEQLDSADPAVAVAVIGALVRTGQTVRGGIAARRASERWPDEPAFPTMIGMLLEADGHRADAQAQYERTLAKFPRAGVAANNLAWLYVDAGRLDEGLHWAGVARRSMPGRAEVHDTLGWIRVRRDEASKAVAVLARAAELQPDNPTYRYHLAVAYSKTGALAEARRQVRRALQTTRPFSDRTSAARLAEALER